MAGLIPVTAACILAAAQMQDLHPMAVVTIMKVEGGKVGEVSQNTNGSVDIGPMQINDKVWVSEVADLHFNGDKKRAYNALLNDGCYNVHVGAWILRQAIDNSNGNVMEGIGRYHSSTPKHKTKYQALFKKQFMNMFGDTLGLKKSRG